MEGRKGSGRKESRVVEGRKEEMVVEGRVVVGRVVAGSGRKENLDLSEG